MRITLRTDSERQLRIARADQRGSRLRAQADRVQGRDPMRAVQLRGRARSIEDRARG